MPPLDVAYARGHPPSAGAVDAGAALVRGAEPGTATGVCATRVVEPLVAVGLAGGVGAGLDVVGAAALGAAGAAVCAFGDAGAGVCACKSGVTGEVSMEATASSAARRLAW